VGEERQREDSPGVSDRMIFLSKKMAVAVLDGEKKYGEEKCTF